MPSPIAEVDLIGQYTYAVQDVESKRKALQEAIRHLDRVREQFRNRHPQVYNVNPMIKSKEPCVSNQPVSDFSDHERRVYRSQDPQSSSPSAELPPPVRAELPSNALLEGVPPDFESQWQAYLAQSRYPEIYDTSHKACALLGYHWAVQAYKALTKKIEPLS